MLAILEVFVSSWRRTEDKFPLDHFSFLLRQKDGKLSAAQKSDVGCDVFKFSRGPWPD
jgi:hypothetical protein